MASKGAAAGRAEGIARLVRGVALSRSLAGGVGQRVEGPPSSASCLPPWPPEVLLLQLHPWGQSAISPGAQGLPGRAAPSCGGTAHRKAAAGEK